MKRQHRLTRSRDFDAVYRRGRSVSTRYLVLLWFARPEQGAPSRLGIAVPKKLGSAVSRNRLKRQLKETWRTLDPQPPQGRDYVLVAREGLPESVEARGFEWLGERVREVLGKAAA